ncbi:MAG: adeC [Clostridiaceae bacterium]|jgi:adenine deaminase|nr:adeC [Clostridiaceae bacterium]
MEADLIIKNVQVFNSYFKKFLHGDVAVLNGKFLHISEPHCMELKSKRVIDGKENYLIPGLIDIHMHIESSMTTPLQFAKTVVTHGVTTVVADPHEIANVFGLEGIEAMANIKCNHLVDIFYGIPSSVPSTSFQLETCGGDIDVEEVDELIKLENVICLGEVMNFKDLVENENSRINKIIRLIKEKKPELILEGHCPKISGLELSKYIYSGVDGDHTQQTVKSLQEKIQNGMFMEIQEKSMTMENINYLMENNLYEHFCLVTDDVMADKLVDSHINGLIKKAIRMGMPKEMAVYVSTYTPANRMKLFDRGAVAPGKKADFILLKDIENFNIEAVYKNGENVKDNDNYQDEKNIYNFPKHFYNSVILDKLSKQDFVVNASGDKMEILCRIMKVSSNNTFTEEICDKIPVCQGQLDWQKSNYCLISVFERYNKNKNKAFGLVGGDIIKSGAVATTYAHDSHNLMVMGKCPEDMTKAANWVIENHGGICVVEHGEIIAALKLPVAGILSEEPIGELAEKLKAVREAMRNLGYKHNNEIMSLSTLCLPVSPALKISDKGLIRVKSQEIVSLFCQ